METKHRKGDFLLETANWTLVSGARNKFQMLSSIVDGIGLGITLNHAKSPREVDEKNGPNHKSSRYLYMDKGEQTWQASKDIVGNGIGIADDVFPKSKRRDQSQYLRSMVKYEPPFGHRHINDESSECRKLILADYIHEVFEAYGDKDPVDVRLSIGVVPFTSIAMLGLLIQKVYIHYPDNPIPSVRAARNYLDYAAENNTDAFGKIDNRDLKVNGNASGSVLHKPMIEWYLSEHKNATVELNGLSTNSLEEINMIGNGFTVAMVNAIVNIAEKSRNRKPDGKALLVRSAIPLSRNTHHQAVWSTQESRCVVLPTKQ